MQEVRQGSVLYIKFTIYFENTEESNVLVTFRTFSINSTSASSNQKNDGGMQ